MLVIQNVDMESNVVVRTLTPMKRIGGSHQFRGYFYLHSRTSDFGGLIEIDMLKPSRRRGPVAQWITRLTTDQKILGSTPGWLVRLTFFPSRYSFLKDTETSF